MYKNRVGILGSPEAIADDIINLVVTDVELDKTTSNILKSTINDLLATQHLVETISKYSCGEVGQGAIVIAFNRYRSSLHLARME